MPLRVAGALLCCITLILPIIFVTYAEAIPAFTRQYKTECSTCHTIYPELNEYGQAFLINGYVYSAKHGERGASPAGSAAKGEPFDKGKIEGILLSGIPEQLPLSVTATQSIAYNDASRNGDDWDFSTRSLVLQAGGAFRELAGFYATYNLYTHNSFSSNRDDDLDELFVIGRHLFNTPINAKLGRFEPRLSLWKESDKVLATPFGTSAYKVMSGVFPEEIRFSMQKPQDALEINAVLGKRVFVAAGMVDVDGIKGTDVYGHASAKIGGADFLGGEPSIDLETETIWDYVTLTLAAYGYAGRSAHQDNLSVRNHFWRAGGDADLQYKRLRLRLSGVTGRDSNPRLDLIREEEKSLALASEAEYQFGSPMNVMGIFRYEYIDTGNETTRNYIPGIAYIPLQNLKLLLQYNHAETSSNTDKSALITVAFSF